MSRKVIKSSRSRLTRLFDSLKPENLISTLIGLFTDVSYIPVICFLLIVFELALNLLIVQRVKYTEIDWSTYMQQVRCFLNGTLDYNNISGDTGPIVYPAGHLYVYTLLYFLTGQGKSIQLGQYFFILLYLFNLIAVFNIYNRVRKVPPYVLMMMCLTSYRIHSIYSLRLFNDPVAMFALYLSVNLILSKHWKSAALLFSIGVSIKMNILLFAPGLLITFLEETGPYNTLKYLSICAFTQIFLGLPFLLTYPVNYLTRSFNLGRIFLYKWTVNWRCISETLFLNRNFHLILLVLHVILLVIFFGKRYSSLLRKPKFWSKVTFQTRIRNKINSNQDKLTNSRILLTLFTSNLIGITVARSLHYQFYVWYYHSIPYLIWSTNYSTVSKLCLMGLIELCWNTYPSTIMSCWLLHLSHISLIYSLWKQTNRLTC
ncbi:lethal(2)neighbour of Tid protein-like [Panonychus citri]|uniref:lethal(2)neighbour of Tid protein-like n=1 Tax=Panonychus citri TaxID=50023 RepID=UPI0023083024|nr:lethal(2)neighbour of Tid protein-like [Panonychus citri]